MNVWRLAAKDLWQQRFFVPVLVGFEIASCEILFVQLPKFVPPAVPVLIVQLLGCIAGFIFCFRTMVTEEKHRAFLFLKTLPVSDAELVLGKFTSNLILVVCNFVALAAYYALAVRFGHIHGRLDGSVGLVLLLFACQVLNNFLFLATAMIFDSEKAVWVPFPFIWIFVTVLGNLEVLSKTLGIEGFVDALARNLAVLSGAVLVCATGVLALTTVLFHRRRRFG